MNRHNKHEQYDPETLRIQREGQTIADFVKSDGWNLAKGMLKTKLDLLDSLSNTIFEGKTRDQIAEELQARASAIDLVRTWIAEVEGTAQQHLANNTTTEITEEYIVRY